MCVSSFGALVSAFSMVFSMCFHMFPCFVSRFSVVTQCPPRMAQENEKPLPDVAQLKTQAVALENSLQSVTGGCFRMLDINDLWL